MRCVKKILLFLLLCVLTGALFCPVPAQAAASGNCGSNVTWAYADGTLTISGTGPMTNYSKYNIPWLAYKTSITHVEIQPGVTTIGSSAFEEVSSLKTVTIPNTVTSIGDNAFCWAEGLTAIDIPSSVRTIGENAFWCCLDLKEITFHEGLQEIKQQAFNSCRLITSLQFPESLRSIGYWAFGDCEDLTYVYLPGGVTHLSDSVFSGCTKLKTVQLNEGLRAIGDGTFGYCFALQDVTIPGSVQSIADGAFYLCSVLNTVKFTGDPPAMADNIFLSAAATILYPAGNTAWDTYVGQQFGGTLTWQSYSVADHTYTDTVVPATCLDRGYTRHECTDCGAVYMDTYVAALGHSWDGGSTSGSRTTYTCTRCGEKRYEYNISGTCGTSARWTLDTEEGILRITGTGTISVSSGYNLPWKSYIGSIRHVVIEEGITAIGAEAFFECKAIETIQIPKTVKSIGMQAFVWCSSLKSVTIPEGVTSIGESTFWGCESMEELILPSTLKSIGPENFYRCDSLKSLTIPEGVTSIGELAFWDCGGLEEITIPSTITTLSQDIFNGCRNLHTVHLPETLTAIGPDAFSYCSSLKNITIPDAVTSLGETAFFGCTSLKTVDIPGGVSSFGRGVFYNCSSLSYIRFAGEPPVFAEDAFYGTSTNVRYPYSLRSAWSAHTGKQYGGSVYWTSYSVTGHNYSNTIQPPTCENRGYTRHTCTDPGCSMYYMDSYTPALGHSWNEGSGSSTYWTYTCTRCGKTRTVYTIGGSCGTNVKWRLNTDEGILTISGTGTMSNYNRTPPWNSYKDSIKKVVVQSGVTSIGSYAFYEHSALTEVTLPDTIRSLGLGSFAWAESLLEIHIPEGVTSIPEDCFWACLSMKEITLPSTVRTIGQGAFYSTEITSINLPAGLTDLGEDAFWQCDKLTSVTIPKGVTVLRETVFSSCTSLRSVTLHDGITEIQRSAFNGCTSLTSITMPKKLRSVGVNALSDIQVQTITFPVTLTFLDDGFLYGAKTKTVRFTGDAPEFDAKAFRGYTGTVYYPTNNPTWTSEVRQQYAGNITWIGENSCTHSYQSQVIASTCTAQGYTEHICRICGYSYKDNYTPMIAHNYQANVIPPTCGTEGFTIYHCTGCYDEFYEDFIPATEDHTTEYWYTVYEPSCIEEGIEEGVCDVCGFWINRSIPMIPHEYLDGICMHCGKEEPAEILLGDVDQDGEITDWDAILLNRYMAGWAVTILLEAADIDGDGEITDWDAILLDRFMGGWNIPELTN